MNVLQYEKPNFNKTNKEDITNMYTFVWAALCKYMSSGIWEQ